MTEPSIYELAGGEEAFQRLAAAHHERCLADPLLNHPFSHPGHPQHVERLAAYWSEVLGGPPAFSEDCESDHSGMLGLHANNGMEADMGRQFVACFVAAMDDAGLPADQRLRHALRSYMEWAVAEVLTYSPSGATVPPQLRMPRWSWDGPLSD